MGTSAGIGIKRDDGRVLAIRLNWDGYPGHAGAILGGWYKTAEQVDELLALGEISELNETPATCDAYHRDHGEDWVPPMEFPSVDEYYRNGKARMSADFLYVFDGSKWSVCGIYETPGGIELNVKVGKEKK